ncbi:cysteine desulfurase family protein [Maricaulis sp. CAU 1757]
MRSYLDHNATTTVRPEVIDLVAEVLRETGNPSSVHADGQAARRRVDQARRQVGKAVCARPEDVIFTGCGTEALNLALNSAIKAGNAARVMHSALEHEAVAVTAEASGLPVEVIPVTADAVVDLSWLEQRLERWNEVSEGRPVVAVMWASNETGTIQPVEEIARLTHAAGGLLVVDAIQAVGKIAVDFAGSGADYLALSSHKFGGPQGVGALVASCDAPMARHVHGGGQESGRRAGTLNVAGIAGLGLAIEQATAGLDRFAALADGRDRMVAAVREAAPDVRIIGEAAPRLPNTLCLAVPGWKGETQVMALDLAGVSISAGSACSSGKARASKVGTALALPEELARGVVRISLGWSSSDADVEAFIEAWTTAYARIQSTLKATA